MLARPPAAAALAALIPTLLLAHAVGAGPAPLAAQAEAVTVTGQVRSDSTGDPLPGVLLLLDEGTEATTDTAGLYVLPDLRPGPHELLVIGRGCRLSTVRFDTGDDPVKRLDLEIDFGPVGFGRRLEVPPESGRGTVVTAREIQGYDVHTMTDLLRRVAPEMIGGGGRLGEGRSLTGRGGRTPGDPRIPVVIVDGTMMRVDDTAMLDQIDPRDVAWLHVVPGAIGGWELGSYGAGGVLRIRTKSGYGVMPADLDPADCLHPSQGDG